MLRIHCQACERYLDAVVNDELKAIVGVEWREDGFEGRTYRADLCLRCREQARGKFFGVLPGARTDSDVERDALMGPPAMPRFLEPDLDGEPV